MAKTVEKTCVRICNRPPSDAVYDRYGFKRDVGRASSVTNVDIAWANVAGVFSATKLWVSRYSDGSWPVLYAARELRTSVSEKGYWSKVGFFDKKNAPDQIICLEFYLTVGGREKSLIGYEENDPRIVHPKDYSVCHKLASDFQAEGVEFIEVPSARRISGINYAVFKREAVLSLDECVESRFYKQDNHIFYDSPNSQGLLEIEDVFSKLNSK